MINICLRQEFDCQARRLGRIRYEVGHEIMTGKAYPAVCDPLDPFGWDTVHRIKVWNIVPLGFYQFAIVHGDHTLVKDKEILGV